MSTLVTARPAPAARRRSRVEPVAFGVLLLAAAGLYLWNLSVSGYANAFYSGAVQAMTQNWTAFFFGSSDAGNTVTVDKPPASLWAMALSARIFGLSSWSVLVPQALMGVGSLALLYAAVRRVAGPVAALVGGALFALTPVVVLMFRFNNPDALLVLLLLGAAYAVTRATEPASTRWLVLAGALVGFAFLTKTAQALLPLPALALAYLWAAPTGPWRRVRQLLAAAAAMVAAAGWWFVVAAWWPADSAPYVGGSTDGSAWDLAVGYNGLGRLFGRRMDGGAGLDGAGMGGGPGGGFGGGSGLLRMFTDAVGGQVSWALPAALLLLVAGLVVTARAARTDRLRAALIVWGGWALVTGLVFSLMGGIFHEYYTVALAPGIAATVAVGGAALWPHRDRLAVRFTLAAVVAVTGAWGWVLLGRTPDLLPWLRWAVPAVALVAVAALLVRSRRAAVVGVVAAVLAVSLGPVAYAGVTVQTAHTSAIPTAGPVATGPGSGFPLGDRPDAADLPQGMEPPGGGTFAGGGFGGGGFGGGGFGGGGFGGDTEVGAELTTLLQDAGTTWSAATVSTSASATLALASGTDVMGIGGFSGSDPAPTYEEFLAHVAAGDIGYFVVGGGPGGGGEIQAWVQATYPATTVDGYTVHDLTP